MRACNDLGYAAAILLNRGYDVWLKDYQTQRDSLDVLISDMAEFRPDLIMFSVTNTTIFDDLKVAAMLKQRFNPVVVLKGAIFYDPEPAMLAMLDLSCVDYMIGGEVDFAIGPIADHALKGIGAIAEACGILFKTPSGAFQRTEFNVWHDDLDAQPFPARHLMNNKLYVRPDTNEPIATIQTARGCPCDCIFCLTPKISGKKVRFRSPANVLEEMTECYEKYAIRNFFFKADTFTINTRWVEEMCRLIINSPLHGKIEFTANSRVNPLRKQTLELMKAAGCFLVAFGFESGSDDILKKLKKNTTVEQNRRAAEWCRETGLAFWGYFVVGFPWETKADIIATRRHVMELAPDFVEVTMALPFYGTELYEICKQGNLLARSVLGSDFFHSSMSGTRHLSMDELEGLRRGILTGFYLRPAYIAARLRDCARKPGMLLNYARYGRKLVFKLLVPRPRKVAMAINARRVVTSWQSRLHADETCDACRLEPEKTHPQMGAKAR